MSVVRFRPRPPVFKANCSQLALSFLGFLQATRGVQLICLCFVSHDTAAGRPKRCHFDSLVLSVLKKIPENSLNWHRQNAIFIQHLHLCRKDEF